MLKKEKFLGLVLGSVGLYGAANVMLWFKKGGFIYMEDDIFFVITLSFFFLILLVLPRTVAIMLGSERKVPENGISETTEDGASNF